MHHFLSSSQNVSLSLLPATEHVIVGAMLLNTWTITRFYFIVGVKNYTDRVTISVCCYNSTRRFLSRIRKNLWLRSKVKCLHQLGQDKLRVLLFFRVEILFQRPSKENWKCSRDVMLLVGISHSDTGKPVVYRQLVSVCPANACSVRLAGSFKVA